MSMLPLSLPCTCSCRCTDSAIFSHSLCSVQLPTRSGKTNLRARERDTNNERLQKQDRCRTPPSRSAERPGYRLARLFFAAQHDKAGVSRSPWVGTLVAGELQSTFHLTSLAVPSCEPGVLGNRDKTVVEKEQHNFSSAPLCRT